MSEQAEQETRRNGPTVRIDTLDRRIAGTISILDLVRQHITDLHDLAYNRHKAAQDAKVRGGDRDYALDTHGSVKARELYRDVAAATLDLIEGCATASHDIMRFMRDGDRDTRRDKTADATVEEVLAALEAAKRRIARGEHRPALNVVQPVPKPSLDPSVELSALTSALRKMHPHERPDTSKLTPLERDAWLRAVPPPKKKEAG